MSAENPYSPSRVSASPTSSGNGSFEVPAHAEEFVASISKGSPIIKAMLCLFSYGVCATLAIGAIGQKANAIAIVFGILALASLIFGLIYQVKTYYRFAAVMNLGDRPTSMSPTILTVLCLVPLVNLVGLIIYMMQIRQQYSQVAIDREVQAPEIAPWLPLAVLISGILSCIPLINLLACIPFLVMGLMLTVKMHNAMNFYARQVA